MRALTALLIGFIPATFAATPVGDTSADEIPVWVQEAQTKLAATFTQLKFERVSASDIPGVVEIYAVPRIIYYAPQQDILILGEMYDASGNSLTERKIASYAAEKTEHLDRDAALVIGSGSKDLIAFLDPDCGFCRKAIHWLAEQPLPGIRQLIYFMPTPGRPAAQARALRALCAPPEHRAAALRGVFEPASGEQSTDEVQCPGVHARHTRRANDAETRAACWPSPI